MKRIILILALTFSNLFLAKLAYCQAPQKFNYQGIARDAKGNPLANQQLALKLSVLPTADATVAEYEETQVVTTNEFGLYTLQIGNGTSTSLSNPTSTSLSNPTSTSLSNPTSTSLSNPTSTSLCSLKDVKWETGNKYIRISIDPTGGTNYVDAGTTQLLSVPYAIYADKAGIAKETIGSRNNGTRTGTVSSNAAHVAGDANYVTKFTGLNLIGKSLLYDNGTNVGIGTTAPAAKLNIVGASIADMRITSNGATASDYASMQLFNNGGTSFGFTKASSAGGLYTAGIPRPHMALFANRGSMLFNTTGNIAFATLIGTTNFTRMFIDSVAGNVGIGTVTPGTKLEVAGQVKITGGVPGVGKVLTSDATGLATWQPPAGGGGGQWTTLGNNIYNNNAANVGIGNTAPVSKLFVSDATSTFTNGIIRAEYTGPNITTNVVGVYGKSNSGTNHGIGVFGEGNFRGLYGLSNEGIGVYASSTKGAGLYAYSSKSHAVRALSDSITAGYFTSNASSGTALYEGVLKGEYTGPLSDQIVGVYGKNISSPSFGIGVQGVGGDIGVNGYSTGALGYGVYGTGGFVGTGVYGYSNSGIGVSGQSFNGIGIDAYSLNDKAINAYSSKANAIFAMADSNSSGVFEAGDGTSSAALTTQGVLIGSYQGTFAQDAIGVSGSSATVSNYGIGVRGYGGYIGVFGTTNDTVNYAGFFDGKLHADVATSGIKAFKIDHPLDPANKFLYHSSVESNDMLNIYNGNITTDASGDATIILPSYFEALNIDFKYQLTVIGTFAQAIISEEVNNNQFKIKTNQPNVKVSWQVTGVRNDAMAKAHRIEAEVEKSGREAGKYLNPIEAGRPASDGLLGEIKTGINKGSDEKIALRKIENEKRIEQMKKNDDKLRKFK